MKITLKAARVNMGIPQKDAAKELHITQALLSRWEIGEGLPRVDVFFKMCELYGVEPKDIELKVRGVARCK